MYAETPQWREVFNLAVLEAKKHHEYWKFRSPARKTRVEWCSEHQKYEIVWVF